MISILKIDWHVYTNWKYILNVVISCFHQAQTVHYKFICKILYFLQMHLGKDEIYIFIFKKVHWLGS